MGSSLVMYTHHPHSRYYRLRVSDDNRKIYIHCLDFSTKEEEIEGIKSSLEKAVRGGRILMSAFNIVIVIALIVVALSILGMLVRVILGPSLADRVVALDAIGIQLMAIVALFSIFLDTKYMIVTILLIGIIAFLGTAVFAKYMQEGKVIEHDRHNND